VPPLGQNRVRSLATLTAFLAAIVLLGSSSGASFGATSSNYSTIIFSDGFESGSLSAWDGNTGNGSATVGSVAAHTGSYGVRLTNTTGQVDVVVKALSAPVVDSSVSFWVRVGSAAGDQTIAEARDAASASRMWALISGDAVRRWCRADAAADRVGVDLVHGDRVDERDFVHLQSGGNQRGRHRP
jgi:hypothetical protein